MKKVFLFFLMLISISIQAQNDKGLSLSFSAGTTMPMGDYKTETRPNITEDLIGFPIDFMGYEKTRKGKYQFNLDANYSLGNLGFGLSLGSFSHEMSDLKYNIPMPTSFKGGDISGFYFGLGPDYNVKFGKIAANFMLRAGMMNVDYTNFSSFYNGTDVAVPVEILTTIENVDSKNMMMYTSFGAQLSYALSKKFSVFTKIDYLTGLGDNLKVDDTYYLPFDVDGNNEITNFDVGHFTLIDYKREETRTIKPQMLNIGVGVRYTIQRKKTGRNPMVGKEVKRANVGDDEKQLSFCPETKIISPNNNEVIILQAKNKPNFLWKSNSKNIKNYEFSVYEGSRVLFSKKIKKPIFEGTQKLLEVLGKKLEKTGRKEKQFNWVVKTTYTNNCPESRTPPQNFTLKSANNIEMNITDITCADPAYKDGRVYYTAKIQLLTGNNSAVWNVSSFSLVETNQTITNLYNCNSSLLVPSPINLVANSNFESCFDFSVPIGTTNQTFQVDGMLGNGSGNVSALFDLPNCICNTCDTWDFVVKDSKMQNILSSGLPGHPTINTSNYLITQNLQILGADNIKGVRAEIVSVKHKANDQQCYTCTKNEKNMGLFRRRQGRISPNTNWNDHGIAELTDFNNDRLGNVYTWCVKEEPGVDFSTNHTFKLTLSLPKHNKLSCCASKYEVCIKYTFTDMNCKSCSMVICYSYDTNRPNTIGGGGLSNNNSPKK